MTTMNISRRRLEQHTFTPKKGRDGSPVPGWFVMYQTGVCDACGGEYSQPNAINVELGDDTSGLTVTATRPGELGWSESLGRPACWSCCMNATN